MEGPLSLWETRRGGTLEVFRVPLQAPRGGEGDRSGTTVLLVGRGSTSARANADLFATARLFQERGPYGGVEVCFVSLAPPCVPAGLRRCVALGARRVLVVPYFINTGLLVRRIASQVDAARLFYPSVQVAVAAHLGPDARLVAALVDRARAAWPELLAASNGRGALAREAVARLRAEVAEGGSAVPGTSAAGARR